eukprot:CAMPEP_0179029764 /NCGR_PEP_ID=MMETSP0796-20121207/10224_1 /TAXON_ID=73915 /ORGANISM="Pyrodinium bahamense, Strain pbaha01" /LENGTH=104 /DNA_ID=CAMNT_0020725937 /DNA_START=590 /DNA_END=904 /DNA_ORIENTATION=+
MMLATTAAVIPSKTIKIQQRSSAPSLKIQSAWASGRKIPDNVVSSAAVEIPFAKLLQNRVPNEPLQVCVLIRTVALLSATSKRGQLPRSRLPEPHAPSGMHSSP